MWSSPGNKIKFVLISVSSQVWRSKQSLFCSCANAWCAGESLGHVGWLSGEHLCEGAAAASWRVCHYLLPACMPASEREQIKKILSQGEAKRIDQRLVAFKFGWKFSYFWTCAGCEAYFMPLLWILITLQSIFHSFVLKLRKLRPEHIQGPRTLKQQNQTWSLGLRMQVQCFLYDLPLDRGFCRLLRGLQGELTC